MRKFRARLSRRCRAIVSREIRHQYKDRKKPLAQAVAIGLSEGRRCCPIPKVRKKK